MSHYPDETRRGPCEECGGDGIERLGCRFICDDCCEALATEDERSVVVLEWTDTGRKTHVVRASAADALASIGTRGLCALGRGDGTMANDPFGEFWDAVDRDAVDTVGLGLPANGTGILVGTAWDMLSAVGVAA